MDIEHWQVENDFGWGPEGAAELDAQDALAGFRDEFHVPVSDGKPLHYLCGHSLGLMPRGARESVERELDRWATRAVEGHFDGTEGWLGFHERFSAPLARLAGALAGEVVVMNTLTVNLHLMMASFFRPTRSRYKILIERDAFPSDRYAVRSQIELHGLDPADALLELDPVPDSGLLDVEHFDALLEAEGERVALVLLPGVQYLTGQALDMAHYTLSARRHGCRIGFDLAHAIGNVPLDLHAAGPDFAVWCSYKYLNAGPGAVAGCFVHERWSAEPTLVRLAGWWGHDKPSRFSMPATFAPIPGAEGWQLSNPPILSLAPLAASLDLFGRAGLPQVRQKSLQLGAYARRLLERWLPDRARVLTPGEPGGRGNQISVRIPSAAGRGPELTGALRAAAVVADWREPDTLRLSACPLYNRYADVYAAVAALRRLVD
jgi:kynureninase